METVGALLCLVLALAGTGVSAFCALAAIRGPQPRLFPLVGAGIMAVSTVDMVVPGVSILPALAWVAVLVATVLVTVLVGLRAPRGPDGQHSVAQHAAALLVMTGMWLAMLPQGAPGAVALAAATGAAETGHAGHAALPLAGGLPLGWLLIAASVALFVFAVVSGRRAGGNPGRSAQTTWRLGLIEHTSMALAMGAMAVGMLVPAPIIPLVLG